MATETKETAKGYALLNVTEQLEIAEVQKTNVRSSQIARQLHPNLADYLGKSREQIGESESDNIVDKFKPKTAKVEVLDDMPRGVLDYTDERTRAKGWPVEYNGREYLIRFAMPPKKGETRTLESRLQFIGGENETPVLRLFMTD